MAPTPQSKRIKVALAITMIRLRGLLGINQAELALRSGLSRQYISMVERQERSPNIQTLMKLCIGLSVDEPLFFITMYGILNSLPPDPVQRAARSQATQEKRLVVSRCPEE